MFNDGFIQLGLKARRKYRLQYIKYSLIVLNKFYSNGNTLGITHYRFIKVSQLYGRVTK